jgi:hypothetical protein
MSPVDHSDRLPGTTAVERSANDINATISELGRRNELRTVLWRTVLLGSRGRRKVRRPRPCG